MENKRKYALLLGIVTTLSLFAIPAFAGKPPEAPPAKPEDAIWANGRLYDTIILGDIKNPNPISMDYLYNFEGSGLMGQRSVAEAAPGDKDYNGGRWILIPVKFTPCGIAVHDPDGDGYVNFELMSEEEVLYHAFVLGHLELGEPARYFLCPLRPHGSWK